MVGRVEVNNKTFIHLVFTEASADWQLWVEPGDKPLPRALIIDVVVHVHIAVHIVVVVPVYVARRLRDGICSGYGDL